MFLIKSHNTFSLKDKNVSLRYLYYPSVSGALVIYAKAWVIFQLSILDVDQANQIQILNLNADISCKKKRVSLYMEGSGT